MGPWRRSHVLSSKSVCRQPVGGLAGLDHRLEDRIGGRGTDGAGIDHLGQSRHFSGFYAQPRHLAASLLGQLEAHLGQQIADSFGISDVSHCLLEEIGG